MAMGRRGTDPNPGEEPRKVARVDDPNVPMADLTEDEREIRLRRVREMDAFRHETR